MSHTFGRGSCGVGGGGATGLSERPRVCVSERVSENSAQAFPVFFPLPQGGREVGVPRWSWGTVELMCGTLLGRHVGLPSRHTGLEIHLDEQMCEHV